MVQASCPFFIFLSLQLTERLEEANEDVEITSEYFKTEFPEKKIFIDIVYCFIFLF